MRTHLCGKLIWKVAANGNSSCKYLCMYTHTHAHAHAHTHLLLDDVVVQHASHDGVKGFPCGDVQAYHVAVLKLLLQTHI